MGYEGVDGGDDGDGGVQDVLPCSTGTAGDDQGRANDVYRGHDDVEHEERADAPGRFAARTPRMAVIT